MIADHQYFEARKVLVTGATGFIGSHLVERLIALGSKVRAMSHYRSDPTLHNLEYLTEEQLEKLEIVRGNIEDPFFVRAAVEGCDTVFHLAALIGIPFSYVAPSSYIKTNIGGTLNVLEACRAGVVGRLVHTSTSECYGTAQYTPIDEAHPLQGQSPYAASKIGADKLVESYYDSFDLPAVILRPFNTFGPRQSYRAVIPAIISQLLGGSQTIKLGALDPVRDLTFVSDTVNGFLLAAASTTAVGQEINLGVGKGISIGDLVEKIFRIFGRKARIELDEKRLRPEKSEVDELISNNKKAAKLLDWRPEISLDDGLVRTLNFFAAQDIRSSGSYGV